MVSSSSCPTLQDHPLTAFAPAYSALLQRQSDAQCLLTGCPATPTDTAHGQVCVSPRTEHNHYNRPFGEDRLAGHLTASTCHTIRQAARRLAKSYPLHQSRTVASLEQLSSQTAPTLLTYLIATLPKIQVSLPPRN